MVLGARVNTTRETKKKITDNKIMLLSAYTYSLYQDKMRQTPPELMTLESQMGTNEPATKNSWLKQIFLDFYYVFVFVFLTELFLLFFTLPLAMRLARTRRELFVHLFFAIFFAPAYLFVAVAGRVFKYSYEEDGLIR
jgi:ABC-type sugar transport system permease subunit